MAVYVHDRTYMLQLSNMRQGTISSPLKRKILLLLAAGTVLSLSRSVKRHRLVYQSLPRELRNVDRRYLYQILHEFKFDRLVAYQEYANGLIKMVITERGRQKTLEFDIDLLKLARPKKWDQIWRVVFFDIPEKKRQGRDALRRKLKGLGFFEWQKSVFVYPYHCRDEIDFIVEFFDLRNYVRYAELRHPTNEVELKLHFNV